MAVGDAFTLGSGGATDASSSSDDTGSSTTVVNAGPGDLSAFQPPVGAPNPYSDPGPWGPVYIGGARVPGIVESVDGCNTPEDWAQQKGTSGNFATSQWKGSKLAEKIKIKTRLVGYGPTSHAAVFALIYPMRTVLRPVRGQKPPSNAIVHPMINFGGITRVTLADLGFPKPAGGLSWEWEFELNEYNPGGNANTGPASPANDTTQTANGETPQQASGTEKGFVLGAVRGVF